MVHLTDTNIDQILKNPGACFDRPNTVKQSSLSRANKLRVLEAWQQWLLSNDMDADHTDENHVQKHLAEIDDTKAEIENIPVDRK